MVMLEWKSGNACIVQVNGSETSKLLSEFLSEKKYVKEATLIRIVNLYLRPRLRVKL
jgi:hypothetical protein